MDSLTKVGNGHKFLRNAHILISRLFQKYWDIVGVNVSNYVLQALNTGVMPRGINNTYIFLIPKIKNSPKDYGLSPNQPL